MKIESNDGEELAGIEENVSCRARFVARDDYVHHGCVSRTYTARTDTCPERVSVTLITLVPQLAAIDSIYMACLPRLASNGVDGRSYLIYLCHRFSARTAQIAATEGFLTQDTVRTFLIRPRVMRMGNNQKEWVVSCLEDRLSICASLRER